MIDDLRRLKLENLSLTSTVEFLEKNVNFIFFPNYLKNTKILKRIHWT